MHDVARGDVIGQTGEALLMAFGMFWQTGWSLVFGFLIASVLQAVVSTDSMRQAFGRDSAKNIAFASLAGAASSSCSYASAAIMRTLFKKGAALTPSLAFLFASTNLVIELGILLYLLMGWQFTLGEWVGGVVLIVIMSLLVRLTYPAKLIEAARTHLETAAGHQHDTVAAEGIGLRAKLADPRTRVLIAQNFAMEWSMLWKDLAAGFLIAGFVTAFVPNDVWHRLFLTGSPAWIQLPANAIVGALIAILTFVCSIGNVPMAAVLWSGGATFGGVLAFLYADLIVLPLLDVYRRYFGWRMAAYMFAIFFVTMAAASVIVDIGFNAAGLVPAPNPNIEAELTTFSFNYTFWLNLVFGALAFYLFRVAARHPMEHAHACGHGGPADTHRHGSH